METGKLLLILASASAWLAVGCGKGEIKAYRVPKEQRAALPAAGGSHAHSGALPHVHGETPAGWEARPPERMRVASFQIAGDGGRLAQMALIPMPGTRGIELESINLWREELGLTSFNQEQFQAEAKSIAVGDVRGQYFEMMSNTSRPGEEFKRGTLGVVFEREGMLWFAKLTGEGALVGEQKEKFQAYLKSLEFHAGAHGEPAVAARPTENAQTSDRPISANTGKLPTDSTLPRWSPPANWKEKTPGPMLTAAYNVDGDPAQAEVTISKLAGEGGGMVPNITRWRGQLGLPAVSEAEIQKAITFIEVDGQRSTYMVDLKGTNTRTGKPARMLAAGVPRGSETWFYKLMGDDAVVEKEKDAFVKFITSAY
jgi:hypothetical protein